MLIKDGLACLFPLMLTVRAVSGIAGLAGLRLPSGKGAPAVFSIVSAVIVFVPFSGLSLSDYMLSLVPGFSMGSIAYIFLELWKHFRGKALVQEHDMVMFSAWNVAVCLCLYASSLGFVGVDIYPYGYGFSALFVITAFVTVLLVLFRNPLSYIFISYIVAYDLDLMVSGNFFDYMTDTVLFFVSTGFLIKYGLSRTGTGDVHK